MPRKYFIKTYGCQMNKNDSERLSGVLESAGYQETGDKREADILIINSCTVRKNAEDKALGYLSSLKKQKKVNPNVKIILAGCVSAQPGFKLDLPHVDLVLGPNEPEKLAEYVGGKLGQRRDPSVTAWVTIMHGCDNFCSYCIVPYVRGREHSRQIDDILEEIKQIDLNKHKEIFLLGQNVNSYKYGLAKLLEEIGKQIVRRRQGDFTLPLERVSFMTSHPRDMGDDIIQAVRDIPQVIEYFHLPIQHGDDHILKSMNRGYTLDQYRELIDKVRNMVPNAAITSDIIVGYPGETDKQFENSLKAIREFSFDTVNTTMYSIREGTAAAKLTDQVPLKVKKERLQVIMDVVREVALENNRLLIGSKQEILMDHPKAGRTRGQKIVKIINEGGKSISRLHKENLLGQLVNVRIKSAKSFVLEGELI
ncbi:MAG: MiaB/RimO family radical SAM methylthiotransferase [Candidatus Margulisbacteria bacterium]|nr:MiaB/RimO family radical SAM methylthiotransferase [Candidatus Margulisiibacteriota bacterium]